MARNWDDELFDAPAPKSAPTRRKSGPTFDVPTHDAETGLPHTKKKQADIKRQMRADYDEGKARKVLEQRSGWERSSAGKERRTDIKGLASNTYREALSSRGMSTEGGGVEKGRQIKMSHSQIYGAMNVTHTGIGHDSGVQQFPGMENPHEVPVTKWEDLSREERAATHAALREKGGTTLHKMTHDFGAQMDQGYFRAAKAGATRASTGEPVPFTKHFYDEHPEDAPAPLDRPNQEIAKAAKSAGVNKAVMTGAVALTSPGTPFGRRDPQGERYSPNIEAAQSAVYQHQAGVHHSRVESGVDSRGNNTVAYGHNMRKTARMLEDVEGGSGMGEATHFSLKTGPFVNSFAPDIPDHLVSDVHTGGGGMLPHQSPEEPVMRDSEGNPVFKPGNDQPEREKSQREATMASTSKVRKVLPSLHFHAASDYAARKALQKRGLGSSVRQGQAVQWGEEQIQRGLVRHEGPYPPKLNAEQFKGQESLF